MQQPGRRRRTATTEYSCYLSPTNAFWPWAALLPCRLPWSHPKIEEGGQRPFTMHIGVMPAHILVRSDSHSRDHCTQSRSVVEHSQQAVLFVASTAADARQVHGHSQKASSFRDSSARRALHATQYPVLLHPRAFRAALMSAAGISVPDGRGVYLHRSSKTQPRCAAFSACTRTEPPRRVVRR